MMRFLLIAAAITAGWYAIRWSDADRSEPMLTVAQVQRSAEPDAGSFACDGRTYCSEMRSCEEAVYFIRHCPGTKMDGDGDGIPCERQWCN